MGISPDACGVAPPRRHEAPGAHWSRRTTLRRSPLRAPEGHPLRARNLGTDCPSFPIKLGSNQNAPRGPDTLATDMPAHHKGKGHAAQTHHKGEGHAAQTLLSYKSVDCRKLSSDTPVGFRTPGSKDNALVVSHAPSGWLYDRAEGLRAQTRSNTENRDCAQPRAPIYKG